MSHKTIENAMNEDREHHRTEYMLLIGTPDGGRCFFSWEGPYTRAGLGRALGNAKKNGGLLHGVRVSQWVGTVSAQAQGEAESLRAIERAGKHETLAKLRAKMRGDQHQLQLLEDELSLPRAAQSPDDRDGGPA